MLMTNNTSEKNGFILLGFGKLDTPVPIFIVFLTIYMITLAGNLTIITLISRSQLLQTPMYILLKHLSICDIVFSSNIVPTTLRTVLEGAVKITIEECITQLSLYSITVVTEYLILTVMSYDRYLAICKPLQYNAIMNFGVCRKLVGLSWLFGTFPTVNILTTFTHPFCGPKVIDHFICDANPLFKMSCSDLFALHVVVYLLAVPLLLTPFMFIIVTYICIFQAISKISSKHGRKKTFSTCSPHLTSVCMHYGTLIIVYLVADREKLMSANKTLFLLFAVVTPLLNPFIYSIRNKEIRKAAEMFFC